MFKFADMTMEFGLLGRKLGHSFSKAYFTAKFHAESIDAVYENFELESIGAFQELIFAHPRLRGMNVTIPYKEAIIPYLDSLSGAASAIGAVNVIQFQDGRLIGHNTDMIGFRDSLAEVYTGKPGGQALILGSGGSAKAIRYALEHFFQFDTLVSASREPSAEQEISYQQLQSMGLAGFGLIVNCTPVGMFPFVDEIPDLPFETLDNQCFVFDLVYNPEETRLLAAARAQGCPVRNGMDMLIRQADAAWEIWMG